MISREPDLRDVTAAVGEVMLRWGFLEAVMLEKLQECGAEIHATAPPIQQWRRANIRFGQTFTPWTDEIERVAVIRNLLAHGLHEARSQPEPEVRCRQAGGKLVTISYQKLQDVAQEIDLLRLRLHREPRLA